MTTYITTFSISVGYVFHYFIFRKLENNVSRHCLQQFDIHFSMHLILTF